MKNTRAKTARIGKPGLLGRFAAGMALLTFVHIPYAFADLYVGGAAGILRYDDRTGNFLGVAIPPGAGGLENPQGTAIGPHGKLYISNFGDPSSSLHREILRYDGRTVEVFVPPGSGGLGAPNDVAFGPDGNLYVADGFFGTNSILRFNGKTGAFIDIFASGGGLQQPNRITFGPCGDLYVGNATSSDVLRFHGRTGRPFPAHGQSGAIFVPGVQGGYNTLVRIAPDGTLLVFSGASPNILRYDSRTGSFLGKVVSKIYSVSDIAFGLDGNMYVSIYLDGSVLRYRGISGKLLGTFVQPGSGGLAHPTSLAFTCPSHRGKGDSRHCKDPQLSDSRPNNIDSREVLRFPF